MEAALLGLLAFCGVIIAALITALYRGRDNRARNNPVDLGPVLLGQQRIIDKLDGLQDHDGKVEGKVDESVKVLIRILAILERGS